MVKKKKNRDVLAELIQMINDTIEEYEGKTKNSTGKKKRKKVESKK